MEQSLKEKAEKKLNDLKALKEHLNTQLHLDADETKVEFEKQKKNLSVWLDTVNDKLHNVEVISEEKEKKINTSIEALRVQATLGIAKTDDAFKEQQQSISESIQQLQKDIADAYGSSKGKIEDIKEEIDDKLSGYHTRFDLFRLQFHLGKEESKDAWEQKKKVITAELHAIEVKIDKGIVETSKKWDYFSDKISDSWKQLKNAFKH